MSLAMGGWGLQGGGEGRRTVRVEGTVHLYICPGELEPTFSVSWF